MNVKWSALLLACLSLSANAFTLVSDQEFADEQNLVKDPPKVPFNAQYRAKGIDAALPRIVFDKPSPNGMVSAPLDVVVKFVPEAGSEIVPGSLKVYYGFMKLDITDRIIKRAQINNNALVASGAEIPAGSHKLTLEIRDTKNRVGRANLSFEVSEK